MIQEFVHPPQPPAGAETQLLLKPREAAACLQISLRTLWTYTHEKKLIPHVRIGNSVRYSIDDLRVWIESNRQT